MHLTRAETTSKLPIIRKGTRYVARPLSNKNDSVPVVVALRDMLKLARTAKEVNEMIKLKLLKINGREVKDYRDSIQLFNIFEAKDSYILTLTENGKFVLEKTSHKDRPCKVINKSSFKNGKTQINLHDGSNVLTEDKINVGDTVYIDNSCKITKHVSLEKGKEGLVIAGRFAGHKVKIEEVKDNKVKVKLKDQDTETELEKKGVIVL